MPSFLSPSTNTPLVSDTDWCLLARWADALYQSGGLVPMAEYPEGSKPLVTDNEERLLSKIAAMQN